MTVQTASGFAGFITVGKDFVSLLRDGALVLLAILLVAFPAQFNEMLVDAGFEEGSIVGFKWKSKLVESHEALKKAQTTITALKEENDRLLAALGEARQQVNDRGLSRQIQTLENRNRVLRSSTSSVQTELSRTIEVNDPAVQQAIRSMKSREVAPRER